MASASTPLQRFIRSLGRLPLTVVLALALLGVALSTGTLFRPALHEPWVERFASGLPSLSQGYWWTPLSSAFLVARPLLLPLAILLVIVGVGLAEWRFGWLRTLGLFVIGQIVGVLGAAAIVAALVPTGWHWADVLAGQHSFGPAAGALSCLTFALATLPSPWRLRGRVIVGTWVAVGLLYIGTLGTLEHAIAVTIGLIVSGLLPAFRHRAGRPTTREWRVLAFAGLITVGAIQVIDLVVPYDGPLGQNDPTASLFDVALDVIVIALIANGVRQGLKLAWWIAILMGAFNLLSVVLVFAFLPSLVSSGAFDSPLSAVALVFAPAVLWLAALAILIFGRSAFRVRLRRAHRALDAKGISREEALDRLRTHGSGTISWMIGWPPNQYLPAGAGVVGFQTHAGVSIALGDPVAESGDVAGALRTFASATELAGLIPCVFSASDASAAGRPEGWRSVIVAEDTLVDLDGFGLAGKRWQPVRTSVNRAEREDISFRLVQLADEPWGVRAQVRAISEQWAGDKGLPEMRFTLGTVDEALDREARVGLAADAEGNLHGITSWLPVYRAGNCGAAGCTGTEGDPGRVHGWTLDVMRRRDGGFGPVMEFLIASTALQLAEQGYCFLSLSGAPLVRPAELEAGPVDKVLARLGELIEPLYGFRSLHKFKQKFNPRAEPLHLLYRDEGDLPRIALALTRAYLPDASVRDLAASATAAMAPSESKET